MRLYLKISFLLSCIFIACLGAFLTMSYFKYEQALGSLVNDRGVVALRALQSNIENNLTLGLPLTSLRNTTEALSRTKEGDPAIRSISVTGSAGSVLYATDEKDVGTPIPGTWRGAAEHAQGPYWTLTDPNYFVLGVPLRNGFNVVEGTVVLLYSRDYVFSRAAHMGEEALKSTAPELGLIILAAVLCSFVLLRPFGHWLSNVSAAVSAAEDDPAAPAAPMAHSDTIDAEFSGFLGSIRAVRRSTLALTGDAPLVDDGPKETVTLRTAPQKPAEVQKQPQNQPAAMRTTGRVNLWLMVFSFVLQVCLLAFSGAQVLRLFERDLRPELDEAAASVARIVEADVGRAMGYGIPLHDLRGMKEYLTQTLTVHPQLRYIAVTDAKGAPLYTTGDVLGDKPKANLAADHQALISRFADAGLLSGIAMAQPGSRQPSEVIGHYQDSAFPLGSTGDNAAVLHIGMDAEFLQARLADSLSDVGVVLLTAMLITLELLFLIMGMTITGPLAAIAGQIDRIKKGDLTSIVYHRSRDEIGRLIGVLNGVVTEANRLFFQANDARTGDTVGAAQMFRFSRIQLKLPPYDRRLLFVRIAFFISMLAYSFTLSFLPVYAKSLRMPGFIDLSPTIAASLPISVFWLLVALTQPLMAARVPPERRQPAFLAAILVLGGGLIGCGFCDSIVGLILWQGVCGLGLGAIMILAQDYFITGAGDNARTYAIAIYYSVFFSGTVCGTLIGSLVADQAGYDMALKVAGFVAFFALPYVALVNRGGSLTPPAAAKKATTEAKPVKGPSSMVLLKSTRFLTVLVAMAIPTRLLIAAYLYYLAPLFLPDLGASKSSVGRVLMAYSLIMAFASPTLARVVDRVGKPLPFVIVGTLISAAALGLAAFWSSIETMIFATVLLGFAQSFSLSSQVTLMLEVAAREASSVGRSLVLGIYRASERIGQVLGPVVAAALVTRYGFKTGLATTGLLAAVALVILLLVLGLTRRPVLPQPVAQPGDTADPAGSA